MLLLFLIVSYDDRGTIIIVAAAKNPYAAFSNFSSSLKIAVLIRKKKATIKISEIHYRSILQPVISLLSASLFQEYSTYIILDASSIAFLNSSSVTLLGSKRSQSYIPALRKQQLDIFIGTYITLFYNESYGVCSVAGLSMNPYSVSVGPPPPIRLYMPYFPIFLSCNNDLVVGGGIISPLFFFKN